MSAPERAKRPFRCLVMDGGGMRGLYVAALLHRLHELCAPKERNPDLGASFDLLAGTSTGGLLAATLAWGCTLPEIIGIYKSAGQAIFPNPLPEAPGRQLNALALSAWAMRFREKTAGNQAALRGVLEEHLGRASLRELWERRGIALAVAVTNVSGPAGLVFKTPHAPGGQDAYSAAGDYPLVEVCLASAAAPVFFPLVRLPDPAAPDRPEAGIVCTDGGLWANSPVLPALLEALRLHAGRPIEIIVAGSSGLAGDGAPPPGQEGWGLTHWTRDAYLLELAMETQAQGHYQLSKALLPFLRVEPRPKIVRLPYTLPTGRQTPLFGLDKAQPKAQAAMEAQAAADAAHIHELARQGRDELALVLAAFGN